MDHTISIAAQNFVRVRQQTEALARGLSDADATVQSMPDASPVKWHLAHTSWFFEEFMLVPAYGEAVRFHPKYAYLFNSYYDSVGARHARPMRGMLTRPSLAEISAYRAAVDARMGDLLEERPGAAQTLLALGLAHEQQHQELLLTDILHLFAQNPLHPALPAAETQSAPNIGAAPLKWRTYSGGRFDIGHTGDGFAFDSEGPRHAVLVGDFALAQRAVTCGEWLEFMQAGGYEKPEYWLSDGFHVAQNEGWCAPLYWQEAGAAWQTMTLQGLQSVNPDAPVCHISFYEAEAYARWAGARLPTEQEWEIAAQGEEMNGHFADRSRFHPAPQSDPGQTYLYGDVWEWTASPFMPYPGFKAAKGAVGEYNGKFMSGQMVLRGGSCATPAQHMRASYRNFFHPDKRWQFSGLRLAKDL